MLRSFMNILHGNTPRGNSRLRQTQTGHRPLVLEPLESRELLAVIHVDLDATGLNDGTSWTNAFADLQDALRVANVGDEIWVAEGTYTPTNAGGSRGLSFNLKTGVDIYGGFEGTENSRFERDWATHVTVLSGDLNGDDKSGGSNSENSYHVVYASTVTHANLDGFTITAGNADGPILARAAFGGGMCNESSSPTLTNVIFSGNLATHYGGGMFNYNSSSPTLANVIFSGNSAEVGGGMCNNDSSPTLTNVTLSGNTAGRDGGSMANFNSSSPTVANSILWGNVARANLEIYCDGTSHCSVTRSIVAGGWPEQTVADRDPRFVRPPSPGPDRTWGTGDDDFGDLHLQHNSPAIDWITEVRSLAFDLDGRNRPWDGNGDGWALSDLGAYEYAILYVDQDATGMNNGKSWDDAFTHLQDALIVAKRNDEIWVAEGTYTPANDGNRNLSFKLKTGVDIYGGFEGTEHARSHRDSSNHVTVLSGDLNGDDATFGNSENSYQVVHARNVTDAILDGFTVTAGNADGPAFAGKDRGGGICSNYSSPTLINIAFSGNRANYGGGMFNDNSSSPTLTNVTFMGNTAWWGGGMCNNNSSPTLANVTLSGNSASTNGGAMANLDASSPKLTNSILWGNTARTGPEIYNDAGSAAFATFSIVPAAWPGFGNVHEDPLFADAAAGDLRLQTGSPAIDAGNNEAVPNDVSDLDSDGDTVEPISLDLDMLPRFVDIASVPDTGWRTPPIIDMGAYEYRNNPPVADAGGPYAINEGQDLTLDASGTTDPNLPGDTLTYVWDLDDDGQYDDAAGATPTVPWATLTSLGLATNGATLPLGLRVDDGKGGIDSAVTTLVIHNVNPTADAGGPYTTTAGVPVTLTAAGSHDPADALSQYEWDLDDDGTFETSGLTAVFPADQDGTFAVHLRVTDDDGATDTASVQVTVASSEATDLGVVDFVKLSGLNLVAGDVWYQLTAAHDGVLTTIASLTSGTVEVGLYTSQSLPPLATSFGIPTSQRLDHMAVLEGETYLLKLSGDSSDVALTVVNLIDAGGTEVLVHGTGNADHFSFAPTGSKPVTINGIPFGPSDTYFVRINGVEYHFDDTVYETIVFNGGPGDNTATLTGGPDGEIARFFPDHGTFGENGFLVTVNDTSAITAHGGGGDDLAFMYDSPGDDEFVSRKGYGKLSGDGFSLETFDFMVTYGYATTKNGGNDIAYMEDTPGADKFKFDWPASDQFFGKMYGGGAYFNRAKNFERIVATMTDGKDTVRLYDSEGDDTFYGQKQESRLMGPGYDVTVSGYDSLIAYASKGTDIAHLEDSADDDTTRTRPHKIILWGGDDADPTYEITARKFDEYHFEAKNGGINRAKLHDTALADQVEVSGNSAKLYRNSGELDLLYEVVAFDWVRLYATDNGSHDTIKKQDPLDFDLVYDLALWEEMP